MKIHQRYKRFIPKVVGITAAVIVAFGAILLQIPSTKAASLHKKYQFIDTNYSVPSSNVAWVAPNGNDATGNGSENSPYKTFGKAVTAVPSGGTVVAKSGIYREPHFFVSKSNITLQAAPHAEVWLKGSDIVTNWTSDNGVWKTTGNYHNFCHVCTTNSDPGKEGVAAYPEQVFINDEPMQQVATKAEVTPGSNTFYVEDKTPTTLKVPGDNSKGYNIGAQDNITYYIGKNPAAGQVEISERTRAFTATGQNFTARGINVAQYASVQAWGFADPVYGKDISGPTAVSLNGNNSLAQNMIITQNSNQGLFFNQAKASANGVKVIDNGGSGAGANKAHDSVFENSELHGNNAAGFITSGCGAYCTMADIKVAHTKNFIFRNNILDNSSSGKVQSAPTNADNVGTINFWCDEGCIDTKIVNNFFTNSSLAIMYEVSGSAVIASNIIESSGTGIRVSGSENVKLYNNTISRTYRPVYLFEDWRMNGCNAWNAAGVCTAKENWSASQGLSWNTSGVEMYNNIISSRPLADSNDLTGGAYQRAYSLRVEGAKNEPNGSYVDANSMLKGFDYNAYYRNDAKDVNLSVWDFESVPGKTDTVLKSVTEISSSSKLSGTIDGRDSHSYDTFGARAANPYFIKEAAANTDYNKSNYNLKPGSSAIGSGKALPNDVALAIDPSGAKVKPGAAVNRGALLNVKMNAAGGATPAVEVVHIPDANLKAKLNALLAKNSGIARADNQGITKDEMKSLTVISLKADSNTPANKKIADITGLEAAVNASQLSLDNNAISNLSPIANLAKLQELTFSDNKVTSLANIASLSKLTVLHAAANPIKSFSPVSGLSKLSDVSLSGESLETPLDMANFSASAATIKSFKFYSYNNKITAKNIAALKSMSGLKVLRLSGVPLSAGDVKSIGGIAQLISLEIDGSTVADISPLAGLTNLTKLNLSNQNVSMAITTASAPSPLIGKGGTAVPISDNSQVTNDSGAPGNIKLVSPVYDGNSHNVNAVWSVPVTIGAASTNFSGNLNITYKLSKTDLTALNSEIARAKSSPSYIQNDAAVKSALAAAEAVAGKPSPSPNEIKTAVEGLKQALDNAYKKEADAQAKAQAAVDKAKNSKLPADIQAAENLLSKVQDAAKKNELQNVLNGIKQEITNVRTSLVQLVADAKQVSTDGMTAASANALRAGITAAESVIADHSASLGQLTAAKSALQAALDGLRADKTSLQKAIHDAESEPSYIKDQGGVKQALQEAKAVNAASNPTPAAVRAAAKKLNDAVAAAKQSEAAIQSAALAAVVKAENDKTAQAKNDAQALVNQVKDPQKKAELQRRLDNVVVPASASRVAVTQPNGKNTIINATGDKCYNIASASTAASHQGKPAGYQLGESVAFKIDCANYGSAQFGYSMKITLELTKKYANTAGVRVVKHSGAGTDAVDITSKVSFGVTADGQRTTISYSVTDGGFGDQDKTANGVIEDPVAVYERGGAANPAHNNSGQTSSGRMGNNNSRVAKSGGILSDTGVSFYGYIAGAAAVVIVGGGLYKLSSTLKKRRS